MNVPQDGMEISVNVSIPPGGNCECPAGWYGDLCECKYPSLRTLLNVPQDGTEISVNVSIPLGEHCECPAGWYGDLCECKYPSWGAL